MWYFMLYGIMLVIITLLVTRIVELKSDLKFEKEMNRSHKEKIRLYKALVEQANCIDELREKQKKNEVI